MVNLVTQPYRRPTRSSQDNYLVTLGREVDLPSLVAAAGVTDKVDLTDFLSAHPTGTARIWAVGQSNAARRAWARMAPGDLVAFYGHGEVYATGILASKTLWPGNNFIWPSGSDWDHVYSLTDFREYAPENRLKYDSLREITGKLDLFSVGVRDLDALGKTREDLRAFIETAGPRSGAAKKSSPSSSLEGLRRGGDDKPKRDRKDIAAGLTSAHIDAAREEWQRIGADSFHAKYKTKRAAKFVIADPDGTEYDAKAILFAARSIAGLDGVNADFDGDRSTVLEPLERLGYVVEDITHPDSDDDTPEGALADQERAIHLAQAFAGQTDGRIERKVRREQRLLRRALGLAQSSHACALCGHTYPDQLLVAAHIKKRSECSNEEKLDIPAVAMVACALGCDALFEHGYVVVNEHGVLEVTDRAKREAHVRELTRAIEGNQVRGFDAASAAYFAWHRASHQATATTRKGGDDHLSP